MKYYIDSQIILSRKAEPLIYVYIMLIIVITLSLIIFLTLFHYKTYYKVKGMVEMNGDYYIRTYIPIDDVHYLLDNDIVRINNKDYKYKIKMLDSEYFNDNYITYQSILIETNLPSKYKFNNLSLNLQFLKEDKRAIKYIFKGGNK